ncbi:hypothetical protein AMATHDRAFT_4987 [Amanita thiersii Skay4041]|uniref:Uncharacterized protein n=1 Tax=Amanita thiersii Skay4041 TaxID=703135 RepID=A0A2A9NH00_9AGAR|nr:hypothetical protein AMATHDRAFT_4987 [Amanita thiersii Skay4041]
MYFRTAFFILSALSLGIQAMPVAQEDPQPTVYTVTRVYHTTTDVPPYLIDATTTEVWTVTPTPTPTS